MSKNDNANIADMPVDEVLAALSRGPTTACQIRRETGIRTEALYQALVWLESHGRAYLRCHFLHSGRTVAQWSLAA